MATLQSIECKMHAFILRMLAAGVRISSHCQAGYTICGLVRALRVKTP